MIWALNVSSFASFNSPTIIMVVSINQEHLRIFRKSDPKFIARHIYYKTRLLRVL